MLVASGQLTVVQVGLASCGHANSLPGRAGRACRAVEWCAGLSGSHRSLRTAPGLAEEEANSRTCVALPG